MLASVELALSPIPRWAMAAVMLALMVGQGVSYMEALDARTTLAQETAKIQGERAAIAVSRAQDSERERAKEHRWAESARQTQEAYDAEISRLNAAAVSNAASAGRMRDTIAIALRTIRSTGRDSTPTEVGTAADGLARVLRESVEEYRALERDAAQSAAAGSQCERLYDSLTIKVPRQPNRERVLP